MGGLPAAWFPTAAGARCFALRLFAVALVGVLPALSLAQEDEQWSAQEAELPRQEAELEQLSDRQAEAEQLPQYIQDRLKLERLRQQIELQQAEQELEALNAKRRIDALKAMQELGELQAGFEVDAPGVADDEGAGLAPGHARAWTREWCRCLAYARLHWLGRDANEREGAVMSVNGIFYDLKIGDNLGDTGCVLDAADNVAATLACRTSPNARTQSTRLSLETMPEAQATVADDD